MLIVAVTPVPILLLLIARALVEVNVVAMSLSLPLAVVDRFAIPIVVVVIVRVVNARVHRASCRKEGCGEGCSEYEARHEPGNAWGELVHRPSFQKNQQM